MIGIIGAGLAGLTAGKILSEQGLSYTLLEGSDSVGGRVKSDHLDGYVFDHGFQVLLNSYSQVQKHLDLEQLNLGEFKPGAKVFLGSGKTTTIADPIRSPEKALETLFSPIGSFSDKLKILKLKNTNKTGETKLTVDFLKELGFSETMIDLFFRPFFSGVFLEKDLETPADFFQFLYQRFSQGYACLPAEGMQEIARQLEAKNQGEIKYNTEVKEIIPGDIIRVETNHGSFEFEKLIVAVSSNRLLELLPEVNISKESRACSTIYFSADKNGDETPYLILNGTGEGLVNHIAPLSCVQPNYAPKDKSLLSVTILGDHSFDTETVLEEIKSWELFDTSSWQYLKTYTIKQALPKTFYNSNLKNPAKNLILAGDFTINPSIEGAMLSGEKAAQGII